MRDFIVLVAFFSCCLLVLLSTGFWSFNREDYISQKVLEKSTPFSVTIDLEFITNFLPANE